MTAPAQPQSMRVGELRPNQLLHTYGSGALADLPNLSVVIAGLDSWPRDHSTVVDESRLLAAVRARLGRQVEALRLPPHQSETSDPFGEWARTGVPVRLFPTWLRCTDLRCNQLGRADAGFFHLLGDAYQPNRVRYVHNCRGQGGNRPTAVPARFLLACSAGHLDDFPWMYFVHKGPPPEGVTHTLRMLELGSTGEAADVYVQCMGCPTESGRHLSRPMSEAFGLEAQQRLPACRGRHPHLNDEFKGCDQPTLTLVLGATNTWFPIVLRTFSVPLATEPVSHLVAEFWAHLKVLASLPEQAAKLILPTQTFWSELERYGVDKVWQAIRRHADQGSDSEDGAGDVDLRGPEWTALNGADIELPDFTIREETAPKDWLDRVVLVSRLREVAALYGFTRVDAPEWEVSPEDQSRSGPLSDHPPTWVPCAELRGEGIFLRFSEERIAEWETRQVVRERERDLLIPAHRSWREQRMLDTGQWPGLRYVLLHTFAHVLIRQLALESGYSAAGIGERIYASQGANPMAGVLLYTAAPDSEGTLGGLVSLGRRQRLGELIEQALESAELCSSDPLCAEHNPTIHGRLYGAACHACLFAAETSCERGNQYLDRALLVDTLTESGSGFFAG
jgi:Domain of unknown function (DUF1998)